MSTIGWCIVLTFVVLGWDISLGAERDRREEAERRLADSTGSEGKKK